MILWIDAQFPPALARFMREAFAVDAFCLKDLRLRDAADHEIFERARREGAALMSKDADFVDMAQRFGPPPQLVWVTCGNVSNANLQILLRARWPRVAALLESGEPVVELAG